MEQIHVSVRSRPLSPEDGETSPWRISGNSIFIPNQPSKFEFDRIFGEECKTIEVYKARTKQLVDAAVRGFNGTVFAYGQTNSGKTHTMRGVAVEPGVIPLAVHDLFNIIQEQRDREFLLRMSYMEIYNEEINDLLAPEHRKLQIHESIERGIYVAGLREEIVASPEQVLDFMAFGESHRHIGETNMNVYSSRSHTIFRMIIESRDKTEDEDTNSSCDAVRVSILNLVDLAGSERAAKTGAEGVRLKEGSHINKSLMTLGTVIKKLSEGAESQGSHVPYRDSKLTRILQPALGGNANTAIICNITLAQIHADETKSSLQFASRALRVTNCVHVNEILTDAALLKRQKKEIEELRARLQGSHSEHFEEEILNLRNTLLQTELERERIALELEEEKKAQAAREKRLQEQAKKIESLSSMVLCSNRDENRDRYKKLQEKRRDTWCPGNLSKETLRELHYAVQEKASAMKPARDERDTGPLVPFEDLLNVANINASSEQKEDCKTNGLENCSLPDPHALLHVTSRKKPPLRKKISPKENHELVAMQAEYEDLLQKFETQKTISDIQIDYLTKQLGEAHFHMDEKCQDNSSCLINECTIPGKLNLLMTESEAIVVIKQLQEKIRILETEKSSSLQNLDSVVELATEQNIYAREKYEKLYEDVLKAQEEAKVAREQLTSMELVGKIDVDNLKSFTNLLAGVQEVMLEVRSSTNLSQDLSSVVDELFQTVKAIWAQLAEFKIFASENSMQVKSIIRDHEKLQSCMRNKLNELKSEKVLLCNQSVDLHSKVQELSLNWQESENALKKFSEQNEMEISEFQYHIETLQKEISCLSSCSLAKEKENMRKDLEKTKTKLKETEFKLRNAIQEKTKLEGEKACAEREIKQLHGQKVILERDISKRDRCSIGFDPKRTKGIAVSFDQTMQEDFGKLEVLAFEMERTIASLEDQLAATRGEKEEALSGIEHYALEMQVLSDKLNMSNTELSTLQDVVSSLRSSLEESQSYSEKLETSLNVLVQEKEELAMVAGRMVKSEWESCREDCKILGERLTSSEESADLENKCRMEKSLEYHLQDDPRAAYDQGKRSQDILEAKLEVISMEHHHACEEVARLRTELNVLNKERGEFSAERRELDSRSVLVDDFQHVKSQLLIMTKERDMLMARIEELQRHQVELESCNKSYHERLSMSKAEVDELTGRISNLEVKMHSDGVNNSKERAKLRMRLRGAQAKLDTFRVRYDEAVDELEFMNGQYEAASAKLKNQLASYGIEVLNLKKELASVKSH